MFVSTSAATIVQILSRPPAIRRIGHTLQLLRPRFQTPRHLVEALQPLFDRQALARTDGGDAQFLPRDPPVDVIAWFDRQLIGERPGDAYLILTCDLCHFLTVARINESVHPRNSAPTCNARRNSSPRRAAPGRRSMCLSPRSAPAAAAYVSAVCNGTGGRVRCRASSPDCIASSSAPV